MSLKTPSKRVVKHTDLIVANDVSRELGFESDENVITLVAPDGEKVSIKRPNTPWHMKFWTKFFTESWSIMRLNAREHLSLLKESLNRLYERERPR